jgi:hypothetical protein
MKIFDLLREGSDLTRFSIFMFFLIADLILTIVMGYLYPTSLFITMPTMGTALIILIAHIQQVKKSNREFKRVQQLAFFDIYDDVTNKTLLIKATSLEEAEGIADTLDWESEEDGAYIDVLDDIENYVE